MGLAKYLSVDHLSYFPTLLIWSGFLSTDRLLILIKKKKSLLAKRLLLFFEVGDNAGCFKPFSLSSSKDFNTCFNKIGD